MDTGSLDQRLSHGPRRPEAGRPGYGWAVVAQAEALNRAGLGLGQPLLCPLALQGRGG